MGLIPDTKDAARDMRIWVETGNGWMQAVDGTWTAEEANALATVLGAMRPDALYVSSIGAPRTVTLRARG